MGAATYTVAYGKGRYVAVGDVILTSTDGLVWTTQSVQETSALLSPSKVIDGADPLFIFPTPFTVHSLAGVTFLEDRFLAVGAIAVIDFFFGTTYYPKILTSVDGVTWTSRSAPGSNFALSDGIFGNGQFVSVGWGGAILSSANAISWSERARPSAASLNSIAYAEGVFVTVGDFGSIFSSVDGNSWTARTAPITQTIYEVTFGNGSFVAVGDGGTIIQSGSFFVELGYSRTGDQMTFSWDAPAYVLQQNDDVANPATWSLVAGGNVSPVTVTAITATKCFRLVRP